MARAPRPSDEVSPPRGRRVPTWVLALVGVVAGAALGIVVASLVGDDDDGEPSLELEPVESPYPADQAANAAAFLDAWERYRRATFRAELTFTREAPGGQRLELQRIVVQQPPRRAVRQLHSVTAVEDDDTLLCEQRGEDHVCTSIDGADYDTTVARELAAWRTAIAGDMPAYAIEAHDGGCFELQLVRSMPAPPYGDATFVCFDEVTGALQRRQVVRTTGTDTEEATALSAAVTDADWQAVTG